jgi:hypothetical protein
MGGSELRIEVLGRISAKCAMSTSVRDLKALAFVALRNLCGIGSRRIAGEVLKKDRTRNMSGSDVRDPRN